MPDSLLKSLCTVVDRAPSLGGLFVSASHQTALDTRSNDPKVGHEPTLESCWTMLLIGLLQCGFDEPSWIWTQIWVRAHMPDYSLNWTARSSAIQRCLWYSSPKRRWLSRRREPFGLRFAMEHWMSGTDARQSAEKPLDEAVARRASSLGGKFVSASHQTGLDTKSMTTRSIIVGIRGRKVGYEPRHEPFLPLLVIGSPRAWGVKHSPGTNA